ncbi:YVTN repeat-like/Quino protein amine dehydrogenase [Wolfiporia cocos MD-104 SS10]|uniref:YVTN repeat-like/Quino protein amine dehydrogenase n=1 Tax=Wolfiporia cocos (strain MD-104) TaxID=742152 RepID=A0A2H3JFB8_WOLCO|nr:YVTN repeat-like/Quino protein amine dehydrogenase [Wolfiporia cocos MD-104 SS10]
MDFTEIYKHTASLVAFSPGTHFLLTAIQDHLIVRRADSVQITRSWAINSDPSPTTTALSQSASGRMGLNKSQNTTKSRIPSGTDALGAGTDGWITHAGWSSDSEYIFGACSKRGTVEVFKMRDEDWRAHIDAGAEGLVKAEWAPDGRTIVCWSEWGLRITLWSLVTGSATYIQNSIHPERGYDFRSDSHYLVVAERHKSHDTLGVYDATAAYRLVRHFPLPTSSLSGIALSPTGNHLAIWEGALEFKIYIVALSGELLSTYVPERDPGFGIRTAVWHPAGLYLAVLGWDDKVYVLETITWRPVTTFELQSRIPAGVAIWREPSNWLESTHGRGFLSYARVHAPHSLNLSPRDRFKPPPELHSAFNSNTRSIPASATDYLAWNSDGSMLLVRYAGAPTAVFLYVFSPRASHNPSSSSSRSSRTGRSKTVTSQSPKLRTVLVHAGIVACVRWNPVRKGSLAVCTGGGAVYLWSDEWVNDGDGEQTQGEGGVNEGDGVAECVGVPAKRFATHYLRWAPDGRGMILYDRETFCCAFEVEEADQGRI